MVTISLSAKLVRKSNSEVLPEVALLTWAQRG